MKRTLSQGVNLQVLTTLPADPLLGGVKDLESTMNTDKKHSGTINLLDRPTSDEIVSGY